MIRPRRTRFPLLGWEPICSTRGRVWRHVGCGSLVIEGHLQQHLDEQHTADSSLDRMERVLDEANERRGDRVVPFPTAMRGD